MPLPIILTTPILALFLLFLTLIISIPLKTYHLIITTLKTLTQPTLLTQLTPYDSIFAVDNPTHPHAANITLIYAKGKVTVEQVVEKFEQLLKRDNFAKLKQVIVNFCGYFYWRGCDEFNLVEHIHGVDFELLDTDTDHDQMLFEYLAKRMVAPFMNKKPLWDVRVINGYKNGSVVVIRIHHCYADGYSQNFVVDSLLDVTSGCFVKRKEFSWREMLPLLCRAPLMLSQLYQDALTSPTNFYTQKKTSTTGVISVSTLPLEQYKQIRRKTNTHFASIGMSLMAGALRQYYNESHPPSTLPPTIGIMHSLPKLHHPLDRLVNHWGVGLFKIPIIIQDPLERLLKTEENFKQYTDLKYDELLHLHMPILGWFPSALLQRFFNLNFGTSMGFTSVPAVQHGAKLFGVEVVGLGKVFGFQWGQTAIATAVYTHTNSAMISIYANRDIVPDQKGINKVMNYLTAEFDCLVKQVEGVYKRAEKLG